VAIFRTDRDRRILGDRVAARPAEFAGIHASVVPAHGQFCSTHTQMVSLEDARTKETTDAQQARVLRDETTQRVLKKYAWAYSKLSDLLSPSWDAPVEPELAAEIQGRLFPLGPPTAVQVSTQLTLDAANRFLKQLPREPGLTYPPPFIAELTAEAAELASRIGAVTREADEAQHATDAHQTHRAKWDNDYLGLREVTSGYLRLTGRSGDHAHLFRKLPGVAGTSEDTPEPPAPTPTPADPVT